ncbi:MAG: hypothetical protein LBH22_02965 [Bacteroidales bacterium]|jgi:hypothetical protein|nr:hypothetical protein [Bacteroidales bacterium]
MKTNILKLTVFLLILAGMLTSCKDKEKLDLHTFEGSWKLVGIIYNDGDRPIYEEELENFPGLVKLEPKDCDTCYTFTFPRSSQGYFTMHGTSIYNKYIIELKPEGTPYEITFIDEQDEPFDGNFYCEALKSINVGAIAPMPLGIYFRIPFKGRGKLSSSLIYKRINP